MTTSLRSVRDFSAHDDDDYGQGDGTDQATARQRVMQAFASLSVPASLRRRDPEPDVSQPPASRLASSRDPRTGRFRHRPDPEPVPSDDTVMTLADATDAAARSTSRLGASGRDMTGERMKTPRPAPRPASELPFRHEVTFPGADHGEDCRCYQCFRPDRPWWLSRRRGRRR